MCYNDPGELKSWSSNSHNFNYTELEADNWFGKRKNGFWIIFEKSNENLNKIRQF
jgi:hypothetical protein